MAVLVGPASIAPNGFLLESFTPSWLTDLMRETGWLSPEESVVGVTNKRLGEGQGFTTFIYKLEFSFSHPKRDGVPSSCVVKLPPSYHDSAAKSFMHTFYAAETNTYFYFSKNPAPVRVPQCYYDYWNPETGQFVLILEDMTASGATVGDQVEGICIEEARVAVEVLARLHAHFWGKNKDDFPWLKGSGSNYERMRGLIAMSWDGFVTTYQNSYGPLSETMAKMGPLFKAAATADLSPLRTPMTWVHGDWRPDNMMFWRDGNKDPITGSSLCALDLQCFFLGQGAADLAYFLISSDMYSHFDELVGIYHSTLVSCNIDYPLAQCIYECKEWVVLNMGMLTFQVWRMSSKTQRNEVEERSNELFMGWFKRGEKAIEAGDFGEVVDQMIQKYKASEDQYPFLCDEMKGSVSIYKNSIPINWPTVTAEQDRQRVLLKIERERPWLAEVNVAEVREFELGEEDEKIKFVAIYPFRGKNSQDQDEPVTGDAPLPPLPVTIHFPDNGFVLPSSKCFLRWSKYLAKHLQSVIVLVEPRLSPEYRFPIPVEDSAKALEWLTSEEGEKWLHSGGGGKVTDGKKLYLLAAGAGASLAMGALLTSSSLQKHAMIAKMVLAMPTLRPSCDSSSYERVGEIIHFSNTRAQNKFHWSQYRPEKTNGEDDIDAFSKNPLVSPLFSKPDALKTFPPTCVITAEWDPREDDGLELIELLKEFNVPVTHESKKGCYSSFWSDSMPSSSVTVAKVASWLEQ